MRSSRALIALLILGLLPRPARALEPFSKLLTLPKPVVVENLDEAVVEDYGYLTIDDEKEAPRQIAGRHVHGRLTYKPDPQWDGEKTWAALRTGLTPNGWRVHSERAGSVYWATFVYEKAGTTIWCIYAARSSDSIDLDCVEVGGPPVKLELGIPGPKPEKITDEGDFPWLSHFPGSELNGTSRDDGLFDVSGTDVPQYVSGGFITKEYEGPSGLSNAGFVIVYKASLLKVGWRIVHESVEPNRPARLVAHYMKGGRDLWASFRVDAGAYTVRAQDLGWALRPTALRKGLDQTCRAAIYGIRLEPATGKVATDAVPLIDRIADLILENPGAQFEIQGYGDQLDAKGAKVATSGEIAEAVRAWLVGHGMRGDRVTAKGYGNARAVEAEDTPEGRAANRRIELLKRGCVP